MKVKIVLGLLGVFLLSLARGCLSSFLEKQGWTLAEIPGENRSRSASWRVRGKCADSTGDLFAYQVKPNRHIKLVPWRSSNSREKDEAPTMLCGRKWFSDASNYEGLVKQDDDTMGISPTITFSVPIAPTALDSTQGNDGSTQDSGNRGAPKGSSPGKKRRKAEEDRIVGGEQIPANARVLDCGGDGDCGWRCVSFLLASRNAKTKDQFEMIREKVPQLGAALRGQCVSHLLQVDADWKNFLSSGSQVE